MNITSVDVTPYGQPDARLYIVATVEDGSQWCYSRPFALKDRAHAEYFAALVRERGTVDAENWKAPQ